MATHQEIAQVSDEDMLARMVRSHDGRFNEGFWQVFTSHVTPHLPEKPTVIDIGCGPGLLLRDIQLRHQNANLFGYDITQVMIDYAKTEAKYVAEVPHFSVMDVIENHLPHDDGSVDLIAMVAVLHVLPEPLNVLADIRRSLTPTGIFLLHDWIARPLPDYLDRMLEDVPEDKYEKAKSQMFRLFPSHNKYTTDDWLWLLAEAGFDVKVKAQPGSPHFQTFVCGKAA